MVECLLELDKLRPYFGGLQVMADVVEGSFQYLFALVFIFIFYVVVLDCEVYESFPEFDLCTVISNGFLKPNIFRFLKFVSTTYCS